MRKRGEIRVVIRRKRRGQDGESTRSGKRRAAGTAEVGAGVNVTNFLPVRVVGMMDETNPAPSISLEAETDRRLEVVVGGGRAIRVPRGFDPSTLAEVIRTLEALGC